jgi:hypothetical protein
VRPLAVTPAIARFSIMGLYSKDAARRVDGLHVATGYSAKSLATTNASG